MNDVKSNARLSLFLQKSKHSLYCIWWHHLYKCRNCIHVPKWFDLSRFFGWTHRRVGRGSALPPPHISSLYDQVGRYICTRLYHQYRCFQKYMARRHTHWYLKKNNSALVHSSTCKSWINYSVAGYGLDIVILLTDSTVWSSKAFCTLTPIPVDAINAATTIVTKMNKPLLRLHH